MELVSIEDVARIYKEKASFGLSMDQSIDESVASLNIAKYEAFYILDCKEMKLVRSSPNLEKVLNFKGIKSQKISELYGNLTNESLDSVLFAIKSRLTLVYDLDCWGKEDFHQEILEFKNGIKILKTSYPFIKDKSGVTTHTCSIIRDVSDLIPKGYRQQFIGPNKKALNAAVMKLSEFTQILSQRELEILFLVGKGYSSRQIGGQINISRHTVDTHRRNIIDRLGVTNSIEAYNKAIELGIIVGL